MKCPECEKEMIWINDDFLIEDKIIQNTYNCSDCSIDVIKYLKTAADNTIHINYNQGR